VFLSLVHTARQATKGRSARRRLTKQAATARLLIGTKS
jgi:hypothetical protein